jgi:hypothetical protein
VAGLGIVLAMLVWLCHRSELAWILADKALRENRSGEAADFACAGLERNPVHSRLADAAGRSFFSLAMEEGIPAEQRARHLEEAVAFFRKARDLEPSDAWNSLNLAHAMDLQKSNGESNALYFHAILTAPFFAAPYEFFGLARETSGNPTEAIRLYGLATSLPGSTFSPIRQKALIEMRSREAPIR